MSNGDQRGALPRRHPVPSTESTGEISPELSRDRKLVWPGQGARRPGWAAPLPAEQVAAGLERMSA